ncbi:hypothetical protein DIPPA_00084 [Diplonema papillatum]|nr:hypothetical protein DIPPA_00084 [Diplonema papillatum]
MWDRKVKAYRRLLKAGERRDLLRKCANSFAPAQVERASVRALDLHEKAGSAQNDLNRVRNDESGSRITRLVRRLVQPVILASPTIRLRFALMQLGLLRRWARGYVILYWSLIAVGITSLTFAVYALVRSARILKKDMSTPADAHRPA